MKFVYKPEGAEPQSWDFNPNKMINAECMEIERRTGWDFADWLQRFHRSNMTAITAYLYVMLKRETPGIKYDQIVFSIDEVDFEQTEAELAETRRFLEAKRDAEGLEAGEQLALDKITADGIVAAEVEPAPKD